MFSTELGYTLEAAFREAVSRRHAYFCLEHLLFALLFDDQIISVIRNCGGDERAIREDLETFFDKYVEKVGDAAKINGEEDFEPEQTPALRRVLEKAILHMQASGKQAITGKEVLVSIFSEQDSHAAQALLNQGVSRLDILNYLSHGITKTNPLRSLEDDADDDALSDEAEEDEREAVAPRRGALEEFAEDLTARAARGELDPVIGRDAEIDRAIKILCRRQKNNPLFLGDPGVGKTAMANALAQRIASGDVPEQLRGSQLFSLHVGTLVAGTKFRGEFEERLRRIVQELAKKHKAIVFIDEIHTLVGAGATGTGSMDAANLLKPALATGKLRCIGSTTHEDFKKSFDKDRALSRRFSTIDLDEPSIDDTVKILEGLKDHYEKHHSVRYQPQALRAAAELSAKHINDRFLPDKAIDVIDEAGAANGLLPVSKRKKVLGEKEIEAIVSAIAKVPVKSVSDSDSSVLKNLEARLAAQVFGQEAAVKAVARAIKRSRASLKGETKPVGSFLFAGPTGVGKTELAKALARELGVHFHRFDMSEYMEKHAIARLIGAPPGYVGYEEGGQLTDLVRKQPYAVLLFDEIEKAHEDIYHILLQVLDDARLTDSQGKKADFRNVIIIMTTNAGSEKASSIGFGTATSGATSIREEAIKRLFRPEFRNRLDETVYFNPLPQEVILLVVEKFLRELETQLKERSISISVTPEAKEWLAAKGFDNVLGARPMVRVIQSEIKDKLADEILFGSLQKGGRVKVTKTGERLSIEFEKETAEVV